ncbi:MAG: aldehyde dehydrogenase family protein [Calditrichaeota bacterium]|nr:MAG: aldehyde dehydrogenase family protein [Calditrichota bacterium]
MSSTLKVFSPFDGSLIKELELQDANQVEKAIVTAKNLFDDRSKWIPKYERIEILERVVKIMESRVEELTKIAAEEGGKPYVDSKVEVLRAINGVKLAIENIGQLGGTEIPMGHTKSSANRMAFTMCEPIGVVVSVSAFNHPLNLTIHQTIPALAVGCPVIIKPASTTPLSCLNFVEILKEAGLPEGWCQAIVCGRNEAEKLVTDSRIGFFSFIGSGGVGWRLKSKLANGVHSALEHGGVAPVIVEPDAKIDEMLPLLAKGGFYHAGQVCVSVQRVFAHESICDEVANRLSKLAKNLKVGDPLSPETEVGPLITKGEVDRVEKWVNEAKENGGRILCGGNRISDFCFEPTVILNPPQNVEISQKEVFGPVVCVYSYKDRNEAIKLANSLPYSFQASVFTTNLDTAFDTLQKLKAAAVMVNDHTAFRVDWMPFGGREDSGIGVGGIPFSMEEMTAKKLMVFKSSVL